MPEEEKPFEQFFAEKIKEKGISLKRLAEMTGIAPAHIENLLRGDYEEMPSAPYFRGYLLRLGKALDFNGEEWWVKFKKAKDVKRSGEGDDLPDNRFIKQNPPGYVWAILAGAVIILYLAFQAPRIFGKPIVNVSFPSQNPFVTESSTLTLEGTAQGADSFTLNGDPITIAQDGTWQKTVLLQTGPNTYQITAKKFLGGQTDKVEQIFYEPSGAPQNLTSSPSSTSTSSPVRFSTSTPATGTYYD